MSVGVAAGAAWRRSLEGVRVVFTTPLTLRVAAVLLTAGVGVVGIIAVRATLLRQDAADEIVLHAAPRVIAAEELYVALADAHAAATTGFLQGSVDSAALLDRYRTDMAVAADRLAGLSAGSQAAGSQTAGSQSAGVDADADPLATLTAGLTRYYGRVESARANTRLDYVLGAAYLRRASDVMSDELLPAATDVYRDAARQLDGAYRDGMAVTGVVAVATGAAVVVVVLVATQAFLAIRTRRRLNAGLLAAAAIVVALATWTAVSLADQGRTVAASRREGAAPVAALSVARILALRSLSDENLYLVERSTDPSYLRSFDAAVAELGEADGTSGLLDRIDDLASDERSALGAERIADSYDDYLDVHAEVRRLDDSGDHVPAVELATDELAAQADRLDAALAGAIDRAAERLHERAQDARHLSVTVAALVTLAVAGGAAVVAGLRPRIREYR